MAHIKENGPLWQTLEDLKAGRISRRSFLEKATALGLAAPVALFVLNSTKVNVASAQDATPAADAGATPVAADGDATAVAGAAKRPDAGTEGQTRGAGGELKILQWQAATHMSIHTATGTKDYLAGMLVSEALMNYLPEGDLIPNLVKEVPSVENGLLAADFSSVTYNLLEGVMWSDGTPFTANDVVYTWQWIMDEANASVSFTTYTPISNVEAIDDLTVKVSFTDPQLGWFLPFTGTFVGVIYPKHILEVSPDAINEFRQNPIGTGPYKVESFTENDQVIYAVNENYREPNKPYFASVNIKGGGDAASAASAVLQTGDWDFGWNLQVEPQILKEYEESGGKGKVNAAPPNNVERLNINFSDPNVEVDGERSSLTVPHPSLTDFAVRQALWLASDRDTLANQFYLGGDLEPGGRNILTGIAAYESPNTSTEFNLEKAAQTLEDAGWVMDGDVRAKDGVELSYTYTTSINPVRQKVQAIMKKNLEDVGFKIELNQVDAGIYFDSAEGNDQNINHFYWDLDMYTNGPSSPFPITYMQSWYAGPENRNVAQKANGWSGVNDCRYVNPDYDALYDATINELDPAKVTENLIAMNDILIMDIAVIPLVSRSATKYGISNRLVSENVAGSAWEGDYWNIANWTTVEK